MRELRRCSKKLKINKRDFSFLETVGRIDVRWSLFMWELRDVGFGGVGDGSLCLLVVVDGKEAHLRACSLRVVGEMC